MTTMSASPVEIYTDGACSNGRGGWAASLHYEGQALFVCGNAEDTTNNRMELTAIIKGLERLIFPCEVKIYSDSQYCVNGINSWIKVWARNAWKNKLKPIPNVDLWQQLYELLQEHKVTAHWIKGHAGILQNEIVDDLAQLLRQKPV